MLKILIEFTLIIYILFEPIHFNTVQNTIFQLHLKLND